MGRDVTPPSKHQNTIFECANILVPRQTGVVISKFLNRNRNISTSSLNALLRLHVKPINVIISHGSITIPYLEAGFPLRCLQRLSIPDIATEQCPWQDSSYTRGQFTSVLSSHNPLFLGVQTISSSFSTIERGCWRITSISLFLKKNFPALYKSTLT